MNEKNSDSTIFRNDRGKNSRDKSFRTKEQFDRWLEESLAELVASHEEFVTAKSNRKFFSR